MSEYSDHKARAVIVYTPLTAMKLSTMMKIKPKTHHAMWAPRICQTETVHKMRKGHCIERIIEEKRSKMFECSRQSQKQFIKAKPPHK